MKRILIILFSLIPILLYAQNISIGNEKVKAIANKSTGEFSIGTYSNFELLSGFSSGMPSSHFVIRRNLYNGSNKSGLGEVLTLWDSTSVWDGRYLATQWGWRDLRIWQKLYILPEDSLKGFIYIELMVYVDSPDSQTVGGLLFLDLTLNGDNNYRILTPLGYVDTISIFTSRNIPPYFIGLKDSIFSPDSSIRFMGSFFGIPATYPDRLVLGNANDLQNITWDYVTTHGTINDLAILIYWNQLRLSPYDIYFMGIYYGLGYPQMKIEEASKPIEPYFEFISSYPNPFNSQVNLDYRIDFPYNINTNITLYNSNGQKVRDIFKGISSPGKHTISWDGKNDYGENASSGIYFAQLKIGNMSEIKKIILIK